MPEPRRYLAVDFGAESGRAMLATLAEGKLSLEEIRRWPNRPVRLAGTLYWDFPFLFAEIIASLRDCAARSIPLSSVGVDTWGVDFGLLDDKGKLLSNPVSYRDSRTADIHAYSDPTLSRDEIYHLTGYEPWAISSLFQLLAMQRDSSGLLTVADSFLHMPDLFNYFLTGRKVSELSAANNSNLLGTDSQWSRRIIDAFSLPTHIFNPLIQPAKLIGHVRPDLDCGFDSLPVVAVCGHDTGAVAAAVPATGSDWVFLSCGTWSILGSLREEPIATDEALRLGFANEITLGAWYLCRNIVGLWLVQELRRKWNTPSDPWDYTRMTAEASSPEADSYPGLVNCADSSLLAPPDMESALIDLIDMSGQPRPQSRGALIRCALNSLALEVARRLDSMSTLTGSRPNSIYMVGGGIANTLLCQLTADACALPVHAGAPQCTAAGNALCQALALGDLGSKDNIRTVMRNSFPITTYEPRNSSLWSDLRSRYRQLTR